MKTLSIRQPWASLIVNGVKDIENRTWKCPEKYIGQRVLIHASSTGGKKFKVNLTDEQMKAAFNSVAKEALEGAMPFGAIIGSVEIVDCVINHTSIWAEKSQIHRTAKESKFIYNWVLANPIAFPEPIPVKGKLSFWEYPNIIARPEEEDGPLFCNCQIPVDESNQVMSLGGGDYRCRYCGGRWYK